MKSIDDIPHDISVPDQEKEKLKEKIREIMEFPVYHKDTTKEFDPRKKAEDPEWFPGKVSRISKSALAQVLFVILGEQSAYDAVFFFKKDVDKLKFFELLEDAGISIGDKEEVELEDGIKVSLTVGKSISDVEKMTEVRKLFEIDRNKHNQEYGELMGFPQTAIDAYLGKTPRYISTLPTREEYEAYKEKFLKNRGYGQFIYSKDHAEEEHAYFLERNRKLKEYAPQFFD